MKNFIKFLGVLTLTLMVFTSCSKDDDPADNDLFVGTYRGSVTYTTSGDNISTDNGSVTVAKVGDSYNFRFSDGIPNITGIEFREDGDNMHINIDGTELNYIRINANTLRILYVKDGATWTADCSR